MYEPPRDGDLQEVKIEVTRDCLLSCVHCSSSASLGNPLQLACETALSLISQAADMQVKSIVFSGGEPLLWPWLADAVRACSQNGIQCSIYSTGIDHDDGAHKLVALAKYGVHKVIFSLHSPQKEIHEQVTTRADSFDRTLRAIAVTKHSGLDRELHFVPMKRNYKHLGELVKLAQQNDISRVSILRFVPHGRGVVFKGTKEMLGQEETAEFRADVLRCREAHRVPIRVGSPYNILLLDKDVECNAARTTLVVGPNGNLYPCDAFKNIEASDIGLSDPHGNVVNRALRECWENSAYLNAVRRYLTAPFGEACSSCRHLVWCRSGCLAQKVIRQESILGGNIAKEPDPLCLKKLLEGSHAPD